MEGLHGVTEMKEWFQPQWVEAAEFRVRWAVEFRYQQTKKLVVLQIHHRSTNMIHTYEQRTRCTKRVCSPESVAEGDTVVVA